MSGAVSRSKIADYIAHAWVSKETSRVELVKQMAAYLVQAKKTHEVDLLVNDIISVIEQEYGIAVADVTSARPLTNQIKHDLAEAIKQLTGAKKVTMSESVDPSLLGGLIAKTAEREMDVSIRGKLDALKGAK